MKKNNRKKYKSPFSGAIENYSAACATERDSISFCTGLCSIASNSGYGASTLAHQVCSAAVCTGDRSMAISKDCWSAAINTGRDSKAKALCPYSVAACITQRSEAIANGFKSIAANTGDYGASRADGNAGVAVSTGHSGEAIATGSGSVAIATGDNGLLKGLKGSVLIWVKYSNYNTIDNVIVRTVDGEAIKENTYYKIVDNDVVEVDENQKYGFPIDDRLARIFNFQH